MASATSETPAWTQFLSALDAELQQIAHGGDAQAARSGAYAASLEAVRRSGAGAALAAVDHVLQRIRTEFKKALLPRFSASLSSCAALEDDEASSTVSELLAKFATPIAACRDLAVGTAQLVLNSSTEIASWERASLLAADAKVELIVAGTVSLAVGKQLSVLLRRFFSAKLAALAAAEPLPGEQDMGADAWGGLAAVAHCMRTLQLADVMEQAAAAAMHDHVKVRIAGCTEPVFNESLLAPSLEYTSSLSLHFLKLVLPFESVQTCELGLEGWRQYLEHLVYESIGNLRIEEMFDIVVDYPDSKPALEDLHECMRHVGLHRRLVTRFGRAIRERLLHPGAATTDIIQQYVSTIRALQHIDPSGTVLDAVSGPIREYLRCRKDTTRCIVTLLTDDASADGAAASLFADLDADPARGRAGEAETNFDGPDADALALLEEQRWEPDPIDADPSLRTGTSSDAISLLVGIYGTKELFVSEYRSMLADRLLAKSDYDCDRELRTLELLKVRFGEASLHAAEVMLRDLAESKRVNANVKSVPNTATPLKKRQDLVNVDALSATIVSQLFWPPLPEEDIKLPLQVSAMLDTYAHKYNSLKAPRVLQWKPNLGSVTLDLTIGDRMLEFTVSPLHAIVLLRFQAQPEWGQAELAEALGAPPDVLRRKVVYWVNQGVLSERRDAGDGGIVYCRNEQLQSGGAAGDGEAGMDVEEDSAGQAEAMEMARLEPFVLGMLTNFDSLPLDRIHNMLKMFATDPPYDKTLEQLGAYMSHLVNEDKVVVEGGLFKRRT